MIKVTSEFRKADGSFTESAIGLQDETMAFMRRMIGIYCHRGTCGLSLDAIQFIVTDSIAFPAIDALHQTLENEAFEIPSEKLVYPQIRHDSENNIAYIKFSDNEIERSIESISGQLVIDVDKNNEIVGLEILSVTSLLEKFPNLLSSCVMLEMFSTSVIPFILKKFINFK